MVCSPAGHMAPQAQRVLTVPAAVDLMDHRADLMGLTVVPEDHTAVLAVWLPVALIVSLTKLNASQLHTVYQSRQFDVRRHKEFLYTDDRIRFERPNNVFR